MNSFKDLPLSGPLQSAIEELGFTKPSPVQQETLPILLKEEKTDFIGLAATGTGKTAAFAIPLLEKIDCDQKALQSLILCPTRELALQVSGQIDLLGKFKNIQSLAIYGGAGYEKQIRGLKSGAQIVVGTPGRIIDHMKKGTLKLDNLKVLILDEADEMISMGFKDELETILKASPKEDSNIWLFSATMSKEVKKVASNYLNNPKQVQVNSKEMLSENVKQIFYTSKESAKPEILCKLIETADDFYGLIFCQTKSLVSDLSHFLTSKGYKVDSLHGDKDQNAREKTMHAFRKRQVSILVCTDVAARGLDVKDVSHVVNYSIPRELDSYVHRIGRTARSGKSGIAISLVTPSNKQLIPKIEKKTNSKMEEGRVPSRKEVTSKKLSQVLTSFKEQSSYNKAVDLIDESWQSTIADMDTKEVIGRFLNLLNPELFNDAKEQITMVNTSKSSEERSERPRGKRSQRGDRRGPKRDGRSQSRRSKNNKDAKDYQPKSSKSRSSEKQDKDISQGKPFRLKESGIEFGLSAKPKNKKKSRSKNSKSPSSSNYKTKKKKSSFKEAWL